MLWNPGEDPNQSRKVGRAGTGRHQPGAHRVDMVIS